VFLRWGDGVETSGSAFVTVDNLEDERTEAIETHKEAVVEDSVAPKTSRKAWRKWLYAILAGYIVLQVYYVREMLAALLIFTIFFAVFAFIATIVYIVGRAGEAGIVLAEPAAKRGMEIAEELSKKTFHRQRSVIAP
jgi:hypothetical protein